MIAHIYALLVGIDEYLAPVPVLKGCVNDVIAIQAYLEGRVESSDHLHIQTLFNQKATYKAIVNGFRSHLRQAKAGDVVLFYYAGHGSQEQTPQEFWAIEPDHLHETLVCYDSRTPTGKDLADKELAKLIAEVAENNPQITIVLDCCHSGSGTREIEVSVRQTPADSRVRSLDQFLFSSHELERLSSTTDWAMPRGNHVLLSACRDRELAKEVQINGQNRGAFSYYFLDTLKQANGSLTIRELFKRTHALVTNKITAQSPQLETTLSEELDQLFLAGAIAERSAYFTVSYHQDDQWIIDAGAIHGIPQPSAGETVSLAVFPFSTHDLKQPAEAIGEAQVIEVLPQRSKVKMTGISELESGQIFKAIVTSLPLPPKGVILVGDAIALEQTRIALQASLYVQDVETAENAEFKLVAQNDQYWIFRSSDDRPLVSPVKEYTSESASLVIRRLEHIARWDNIIELASPATSRIQPNAVQMQLYQDGQELQDAEIRLSYQQNYQTSKQPSFKIKLTNHSDEALYCALLNLTDRYAITASLFEAGGIWLNPGEEVWALGNRPIYPTVPEKLWKQGVTETRDVLKLIVATTEFDATLLEQAELDLPSLPSRQVSRGQGTLNRLMNRIQHRELKAKPEEELYDDWVTSQIMITTVRPQASVSIPRTGSTLLAPGVTLLAHPSLSAQVRLAHESQSTRSIDNTLPLLLQEIESQPFQFTMSRSSDPGLSLLELTQIEDRSQITPLSPLKLLVDTPLAPNELLIAIAHDGEFFLPLGSGQLLAGKTEITLTRLPDVAESRSIGGAVRMFFQKIVMESLGLDCEYPRLAIAQVNPDETVTYIQDREMVKAQIARSKRLVLFVHGIAGDTRSLAASLQRANLSDRYDTILTFDYENLNTPIEENARLLKQKLAEVGLGDHHSKLLHIVAYSMGGLVSRWMIEKEGGDRIVQHLIMFGTPNAGSPWATISDWALATLSLGLNGLSKITWSAPIVGMLINIIHQSIDYSGAVRVSLDQMRPSSMFLQALANNAATDVPYTIIAGNTSIIAIALQKQQNQQFSPLEKLMKQLFNDFVALPFFNQSNDIAATVRSIKSVSWVPVSQIHEIGCDHLVYFTDPIGLEAFSKALTQPQDRVISQSPPIHTEELSTL
ncbi:MAG: caspase family protein [Leptolyngbya sp. Prado105]|jgi:pimeloyl-ACP methyl ester carboxylesterase|nr:caspase family protein [Leptolyngbya sp. Prado105]